jgi:hypothetical protein
MASEERTLALLEEAGFTAVRAQEVPWRLVFRDVDEFVRWTSDVGGPFAMVVRALSNGEREAIKARLDEAFASFVADGGYEFPSVSLAAIAS